jgi:Pentapeptide repeats (8 copies)
VDNLRRSTRRFGSEKLDVRIGGIYALERIARDSARDHPVVMEVLAAFIREHSREPWSRPPPPSMIARLERFRFGGRFVWARPDVQAAASVVGRRDAGHDVGPIDLHGAHLVNTNLIHADFRGAILSDADLRVSVLARARLNRAILEDTNFREAFLDSADFRDANLTDANLIRAHLEDADLSGACLTRADLTDANLTDADLTDADLSKADLRSAILVGADLARADLADAQLGDANLADARWPGGTRVPEGWNLDTGSGRLRRAD